MVFNLVTIAINYFFPLKLFLFHDFLVVLATIVGYKKLCSI